MFLLQLMMLNALLNALFVPQISPGLYPSNVHSVLDGTAAAARGSRRQHEDTILRVSQLLYTFCIPSYACIHTTGTFL